MNITPNNLCIIPARGGSKRIPKKNIKDFLGKPVIAYSIQAALDSGLFSEVMVSTDDAEIAEVAKLYGASVPFLRSDKNADDFATTMDVLTEVLLEYEKRGNFYENICCIYPCAPFVNVRKLSASYELLAAKNFDSVFPVMAFSFPVQRAMRLEDQKLKFINPEYASSRSQDLEKRYHDAGQFYWMKVATTLKQHRILTDNSGGLIISELEGQDIDNLTDWKLAELKYQLLQNDIS